jgi:phosphoadenosine phosphosulfate reductase
MARSLKEIDGPDGAATLAEELDGKSAFEIVERAAGDLGREIVFATSLGLEDVVLLDLVSKANGARIRIVTLDTGRLHGETYALLDRLENRYRLGIETYFPDTVAVESLVRRQGPNGFYASVEARRACCDVRKLAPMRRALQGARAWMTGMRRDQAVTRDAVRVAEWDGRLKLNPLVSWSVEDVWEYVRSNDVPFNPLHERGYPSIGCAPCTRAIEPGEDVRAGRWWWERPEHKECGLHTDRAVALRAAAKRSDQRPD